MGKDKGYLELTTSEFLDVISGAAKTKTYTVSCPGGTRTATLKTLLDMLAGIPEHYDIWNIAPQLDAIMDNPIHQHQGLGRTEIVEYIDKATDHYNPDRLKALYADVCTYYYSIIAVRERVENKISSTPYTTDIENVRYMKIYLASKVDKLNDPHGDNSEVPTKLQHYQISITEKKARGVFKKLQENLYLSKDTSDATFMYFFGFMKNKPNHLETLHWLKSQYSLGYFINQFVGERHPHRWELLQSIFRLNGNKKPNIKAITTDISKMNNEDDPKGPPKDASIIDEILKG